MMIFWIPLLLGVVLEPTHGEDTKLLLVQTLFRHGARSPVILYPNDPNPAEAWIEGLGKLTLLGKKQQYGLGTLFRKMYQDFITTNPTEVTVNSSDSDRCVRSALANVAAFYKPSPEWAFDDTINWQPIRVNSVPEVNDRYLSPRASCPVAEKEGMKKLQKENDRLRTDHGPFIRNLSVLSGRRMDNLISLFLLYDTIEIEGKHGLIVPQWVAEYWDELTSLVERGLNSLRQPESVLKLRTGPLLGRIVEDMVKKSTGGIPDIKVRMYSTHDYVVSGMLEILNVSNSMRPPFCATVIFELHEKTDGEKVVRLLYLNSTTPENVSQEPHLLILDGCSEFCPLDYLVKQVKHSIPENWEKECGFNNDIIFNIINYMTLFDSADSSVGHQAKDFTLEREFF